MPDCDYLLIGGGVAAYNAAKKIRRVAPHSQVMMVSDDSLPPYDLPPLSKEFLRGERSEAQIIYPRLDTPGAPIDIVLETSATKLDVAARIALLHDGREVRFAKALIATGASPIPLTAPGAGLDGVFYMRSAADARAIAAAARIARTAVVIGGGFIGLETAASLRMLGLDVTVVEALDRVWPRVADPMVSDLVRSRCVDNGIDLLTGRFVTAIEGQSRVEAVTTSVGDRVACDIVCIGIGITPNVRLAADAGLDVADGIVVDAMMRTSAPGIYAAGDVVRYPDAMSGASLRSEHWGHAEYSGQLAGANMAGAEGAYDFMAYAWSDVFDLHIESSGCIDGYDEIVVRGEVGSPGFTSLYVRQGALIGYCAINVEPVDFAAYRRLIRSRQLLPKNRDALRDPSKSMRSLIEAG